MNNAYSKKELLEMYYNLKRGRIFTEKMHEAVYQGMIRSSFHSPYGQEAIGVGIVSSMRKTDWLSYTHRLQTALIMRYDISEFISELYGFYSGPRHGSAFDYHLADYRKDGRHILGIPGTLGGAVPLNTGYAYALKMMKRDEVCVIVHGDGGCSEGAVYEAWNIAALHKVPAVYVIENNEWAMTVPLKRQSANPNISDKAAACGLPVKIVDGNDILAIRMAMDEAIENARHFEPSVIEMKCLRWDAHFIGQGNDYRDDISKVDESKNNDDCVKSFETYLIKNKYIDHTYIDEMSTEISENIDQIMLKVANGDKAKYEDIYKKENIYADPLTGGDL